MSIQHTFESIVATYKALLAGHPGEALEIGDSCYAVMVGGAVRLAMVDAVGNVLVEKATEFDEEFWDVDNGCWEGASWSGETAGYVHNPRYIPISSTL